MLISFFLFFDSATSYDRNHGKTNQNNSPAVDRLIKKISKKNTKGETPLHTAAIRGSSRLVIISIDDLLEKISTILTDCFFGFRSNNCSRWVLIPMFKTMLNGLLCMKLAIGGI
jgi:hypothetical protein